MALISCPECGRENISDKAVACPSCGFPIADHFKEEFEKAEKIRIEKEKEEKINARRKAQEQSTEVEIFGEKITVSKNDEIAYEVAAKINEKQYEAFIRCAGKRTSWDFVVDTVYTSVFEPLLFFYDALLDEYLPIEDGTRDEYLSGTDMDEWDMTHLVNFEAEWDSFSTELENKLDSYIEYDEEAHKLNKEWDEYAAIKNPVKDIYGGSLGGLLKASLAADVINGIANSVATVGQRSIEAELNKREEKKEARTRNIIWKYAVEAAYNLSVKIYSAVMFLLKDAKIVFGEKDYSSAIVNVANYFNSSKDAYKEALVNSPCTIFLYEGAFYAKYVPIETVNELFTILKSRHFIPRIMSGQVPP